MTPFFYAGFDTIPQQAEEASEGLDWKKFGIIPALALIASGIFYLICIYAFGTMIDWHEFVKSSVPALAVLQRINIFLHCDAHYRNAWTAWPYELVLRRFNPSFAGFGS